MDTEILDLAEGDGLILGCGCIRWRIILRICTESTDIHFPSRNCAVGVNLRKAGKRQGSGDCARGEEEGPLPQRLRKDLGTSDS